MPAEVSTCGENTTSGRWLRMVATTSSTGQGTQADWLSVLTRRAFSTVDEAGMWPMSKICVQR